MVAFAKLLLNCRERRERHADEDAAEIQEMSKQRKTKPVSDGKRTVNDKKPKLEDTKSKLSSTILEFMIQLCCF